MEKTLPNQRIEDDTTHAIGWKARDFALPAIDGKTYSLAEVRGPKGTLVVFICNHCPYVKAFHQPYCGRGQGATPDRDWDIRHHANRDLSRGLLRQQEDVRGAAGLHISLRDGYDPGSG